MKNKEINQLLEGARQALRLYYATQIIGLNTKAIDILRQKLLVGISEKKQVNLSRQFDEISQKILASKKLMDALEKK